MAPTVTVLISGRGSNLIALHEKAQGYRVGAVISNRADAAGLSWAASHGIPTQVVSRESFASLAQHKEALLEAVKSTSPDLVALAGFMMILQPEFVEAFSGRLVNIHPSLLPKYPGLDTHARALAAGDSKHGASVHFVGTGLDTGPLIAQAVVPVLAGDTEEALAARTLTEEHKLYPWVVKCVANGAVKLEGDAVVWEERGRREAQSQGFQIPE